MWLRGDGSCRRVQDCTHRRRAPWAPPSRLRQAHSMSDASLLSTGIGCCVRDNTVPPCMHGHAVKVLASIFALRKTTLRKTAPHFRTTQDRIAGAKSSARPHGGRGCAPHISYKSAVRGALRLRARNAQLRITRPSIPTAEGLVIGFEGFTYFLTILNTSSLLAYRCDSHAVSFHSSPWDPVAPINSQFMLLFR